MSNSYFLFKQFRVEQDRCAMKVSTDACIQGAWTPVENTKSILDVGTGTGLLSLMLAQRQPEVRIVAIEQDEAAARQAKENIDVSPFSNRINVFQVDALHWTPEHEGSFDLIICNPPFFQNSLKGPDAARNAARHNDTLTPKSLADLVDLHLAENGSASFMWPLESYALFKFEMQKLGMNESEVLIVRDRPGKRITRVIGMFKRNEAAGSPTQQEFFVRDDEGNYSNEFVELLKPYYLHL